MERTFALIGSLVALLAVVFGAFGAHALRARLSPEDLTIFETGVRYQMYHALALFDVAWAVSRWPSGATTANTPDRPPAATAMPTSTKAGTPRTTAP